MSLFSAIILPKLEAELINQEPAIAEFLINQAHSLATDVLAWAESKIQAKAKVPHAAD